MFQEAKEVVKKASDWLNTHTHQFIPAQHAKGIDVDGVEYMPGVYDSGFQHEDWAAQFYQEVGGES